MPERIQRRRSPGWRMPPGAVYVGRPTTWGNPFVVEPARRFLLFEPVRWDVVHTESGWISVHETRSGAAAAAVERYRAMALNRPELHAAMREELQGHDLACWCRLDEPCHADVLLELANG